MSDLGTGGKNVKRVKNKNVCFYDMMFTLARMFNFLSAAETIHYENVL